MEPKGFKQLVSQIRSGVKCSGYYIFGDEAYLKGAFIGEIRSAVLATDFAEFNFDELWAGDLHDPKALFDAVLALPMMTDRRLVVLREVENGNKDFHEKLASLDVPESCVFVAEAAPDKKTSYHKTLLAKLSAVECSIEKDTDMAAWVIELGARSGVKFSLQIANYLVERAGTNLLALSEEIEKLAIAIGEKQPAKNDIDELVATSRSANIFRLTDCISSRQFTEALALASRLYDFGESTIMMIAFIKYELFNLLQIKTASGGAVKLRCPEWKAKKYRNWAASWTIGSLRNSVEALSRIDIGLKSGRLTEREAYLQIIAELATY